MFLILSGLNAAAAFCKRIKTILFCQLSWQTGTRSYPALGSVAFFTPTSLEQPPPARPPLRVPPLLHPDLGKQSFISWWLKVRAAPHNSLFMAHWPFTCLQRHAALPAPAASKSPGTLLAAVTPIVGVGSAPSPRRICTQGARSLVNLMSPVPVRASTAELVPGFCRPAVARHARIPPAHPHAPSYCSLTPCRVSAPSAGFHYVLQQR